MVKSNRLETGSGFMCKLCGKLLARRDSFRYHIRDAHYFAGYKFRCLSCLKVAVSINAMKQHFQHYHPNIKDFYGKCMSLIEKIPTDFKWRKLSVVMSVAIVFQIRRWKKWFRPIWSGRTTFCVEFVAKFWRRFSLFATTFAIYISLSDWNLFVRSAKLWLLRETQCESIFGGDIPKCKD